MPGVLRVGDIGFGVCQGQFFIATVASGLGPYVSNEQPIAGVGCIAASTCGHPVTILSGSGIVDAGGRKVSRIGDIGLNSGVCTFISGNSLHDIL